MKIITRYTLTGFFSIIACCLFSQTQTAVKKSSSGHVTCYKFRISKPLTALPPAKKLRQADKKEAGDKLAAQYDKLIPKPVPGSFLTDPLVQHTKGTTPLDTPKVNFNGVANALFPPDPDGAVGLNYYVQADNLNIAVYDKSGNVLLTPRDLGYLWDSSEVGDPVVLYDKFADRWFISQLEYDSLGYWSLETAVSTTNDPTGTYYLYYFFVGGLSGNPMPDYPKYSIWTDGYYCTCRFFGGPEQILVLERARMLAGSPSAVMMYDSLPESHPFSGDNRLTNAPKTLDCDGALPPYGSPNFLFFFENTASGGPSNSIVIYKIATDTTLKTVTSSVYDSLPTSPFNAYFNGAGNYDNICQPGYAYSIDDLDGSFNFRVPYMRFVGYNSVVLSNTVNLGGLVAGIRWYELRQNTITQKWSIYQQGTYGPNDGISRWNASICMNNNGDISLAYNVSDSISTFPGIRYTGRYASDPLGQMTFREQTAVNGSGVVYSYGRWGDYSQSTLDPSDGLTFWHTNEYVDSSNEATRVFSFKLTGPTTEGVTTLPKAQANLTVYQSGSNLNIIATALPNNENTIINLFDINGKQLTSEWVKPQAGKIESIINISNLAAGTYLVRIGNAAFQVVKKVIVN